MSNVHPQRLPNRILDQEQKGFRTEAAFIKATSGVYSYRLPVSLPMFISQRGNPCPSDA